MTHVPDVHNVLVLLDRICARAEDSVQYPTSSSQTTLAERVGTQ